MHRPFLLLLLIALTACNKQASRQDHIDLPTASTNSQLRDLTKLDDKHLIVNVSNAENGAVTEVYRIGRLSASKPVDARILGGNLKFIRVDSDGTVILELLRE